MVKSYLEIPPKLARRTKLVVTDVDGTLSDGGDSVSPSVLDAIRQFEEGGIMVGLASGRTLAGLESLGSSLGITGPIIAENGGIAKLKLDGELVELGYSREPALEALAKLKTLFPDAIEEREDNRYRLVDVVIRSRGVDVEELRKHLEDVELLDSGYILHLIQKGVSKGRTLMRLLSMIEDGRLSPTDVMVFGDSPTDISLFQMFPHSVLVVNPRVGVEWREVLQKVAEYASELPFGDGFAQVAFYLLHARRS